ncbi:HAMP domain-containing histidine kinase [Paenibacillus profundus]|uniref:histidine kinase n=1 Tax=Paenibacillus profundus TaxID=1173085 RepID=A0ABS8YNT0_9BACL|nr:HAMP domain-containing sensor histidine kinase [Paenibacillus profundus]MCE5173476.1 HAMP domain-containing histidine kinase [Paenibacillus profundus]
MIRKISIKFLIGFFLIFSLSFIVLNQTVKEFIRTSNQKLVTSELVGVKNNSNVYVRQAFLINHFTSNELYFGEMALEMANDLKHATGSNVSVYTVDGELLYSSDKSMFPYQKDSDLKQAIKGRTAYSITYDHNTASVLFSYPVVIDGSKVGILRFSKDFSLIYAQSGRILDIIFFITLAIFAAAFLFSYILSRHITIPLVKLTWASTEVKDGNLDVRIRFNRKDEIGRLADNFNDMIDQISRQITIIKKDRDYLKELHQQEKRFFDNITHELKTPLTSILGYAELIRENGEKDPHFFEKGMNHIIEESRRLHTMVLKLLEVSRNNSMISESDKINAGIILQDVCDSMAIRAQRYKKSIKYQIEDDLVVFGQGDRLRQLFINLLDNAIKYSLSLSEISVKALHVDGKVRFVFDNPSDPIEADQLANLFHPFYLAHPSVSEEGSVGLGLGIVKSIVHDFGGTISFDSQNRHVTVTVEFDGFNSKRTENRS